MPSIQRHLPMLTFGLLALAAASPACAPIITDGGGGDDPANPDNGGPAPPDQSGDPEAPAPSDVVPVTPAGWERFDFTTDESVTTECDGERWVTYSQTYRKWVGAILCSPDRYKLVMNDAKDGPYLELTDFAGHGQDHCELVNPTFTISNEDDITSGCPDCLIGSNFVANGPQGYTRGYFGEAFQVVGGMPQWAYQTSTFIECGVSIP